MDTATTLVDQIRRLWFFQSDHHAEMWRNKAGEIGYSPACDHRFQKEVCDYHCDSCAHKAPTALTDERIKEHLRKNKVTLGAYQLRGDQAGWLCLDVDGAWFAEIKTPTGRLRDEQRLFAAECPLPTYELRSQDEAIDLATRRRNRAIERRLF